MKLIIGLGNPGKEYEKTRHNVGFMCVDRVREKLTFPPFTMQKKFNSLVTEGSFNGEKILLAKPQTFMNSSGEAVQILVNFYHVAPADIWVIYDDIDLPLGSIRVRSEGSAGSHNGMKSVIASLGFQNFPRIRIGIESRGESAPAQQDLASFVLEPFKKTEHSMVFEIVEKAADALLIALEKNVADAMERYN